MGAENEDAGVGGGTADSANSEMWIRVHTCIKCKGMAKLRINVSKNGAE